ncbi:MULTISPECIES: NlpC/P60 family peptidoglycan-binding protein RipD [unclassified Mycolicibacterium]|uniref:NlpC/P60 family peptidoglycan-binding protein RipD n=1 Tax=unclassified Mycolicibacterium TaxID=2636767 RepID=UPI0012DE6CC8|nr:MULTISPECIES: NlpC/P60 family peptidoglycan-binding protein RipD [unclassified Mycolicibacterium]MUL85574.1 NlpC/P60 family peptidoglycan-binding protein RipD [Mycolicibacterium sp. CBMA 329]MUL88662.1 NlpC/P60 family peptidoglycan-binding protein RipD [Mycolicibacterium sp. CBMA 331]MUM02043.1 NlpC/P60 family peptidoglycan-binding protein RipD [Mycolicibacterium sp. CBMA 334]MUM26946.1 NlpC/P60 family peptidoglycan-binding protein RipD [Mycolicibacterium sp. CBMA 295]MUM40309.1 NlpC/P60 fa
MRRTFALLFGLAFLVAAPGLAGAAPIERPTGNQRYVDYVIARAMSQRGVPFSYGGGDVNGPTRGVARTLPAPGSIPPVLGGGLTPGLSTPGLSTPVVTAPVLTTPGIGVVPDPSANVVGFDASGLIVYAFGGVGVKMPRSSGEQYKVGQKVLPAQALPGDLIFYGPEGTQSVALYLGNNQMIQGTEPAVAVTPVRAEGMTPYLVRIIA